MKEYQKVRCSNGSMYILIPASYAHENRVTKDTYMEREVEGETIKLRPHTEGGAP